MTVFIATVYGLGALLVAIGFFRYRSNLKKNVSEVPEPEAINTGTPLGQSVKFIKVICK